MKKIFVFAVTGLAIGSFTACNNANKNGVSNTDSTNQSNTSTSASSSDTTTDSSASIFAVAAANGGLMEIEMGKLAEKKGYNKRIREFGKMTYEDHSKLGNQLKGIASMENIILPDSVNADTRKNIDDLGMKSGKDFDKSYIDMMVDDHEKDIHAFQMAASDLKDTTLSAFATQALPTLQKHLDSAQAIQKSF